jgi:FixJ family two-component response regulator
MKKLFVVDTDKDFQTQLNSLYPSDQVDVHLFSSGMEIFSLIKKEKPFLIFVSLEVPDVNDFVMYDLLKKTTDNSIPVVVTYSNQTENDLQQYKKLKFQPKDYCKKPISNDDIHRLLKNHQELDEEDDDEFSDDNIDRLVRGDYLTVDFKEKDDTKELLADTKNDIIDEVVQSEDGELEIADILETGENKTSRADNELRNQVISLERQNEFLRSENKELSKAIEALKANKNESGELVQEAEERLRSEFSRKETYLEQDLVQLKEEKEKLKQLVNQLQNDSDELKKREELLDRTLSTLTEEKVTLSEKVKFIEEERNNLSEKVNIIEEEKNILSKKVKLIEEERNVLTEQVNTLEENLTNQRQEMEEKEHTHLSALENLNKELEKVLDRLQFYKYRVNELGGLLQQALELTQPQNLE